MTWRIDEDGDEEFVEGESYDLRDYGLDNEHDEMFYALEEQQLTGMGDIPLPCEADYE